jgi:hypothetical protein
MPHLQSSQRSIPLWNRVESWIAAHTHAVVWVAVICGFYLRFHRASGTYLNGDETQNMFPPLQHGLQQVYEAGLAFPNGPLLSFLLHFMSFFGSSELYLRMPSVLAGALTPFVVYLWVRDTFGKGAGIAAAIILSFAPPMVHVSAEVRSYAIHMFWLSCSLYFLERTFREKRLVWMRMFGASLLLALLTMYMSVWYVAAIGAYALLRILNRELPFRLVIDWVLIQTAAAAVCVAAYTTHLYKLRNSQGEVFARNVWLRWSYYHPESQNLLQFLSESTTSLFSYLYANSMIGLCMIAYFLGGLALMFLVKRGTERIAALSLLLPLLATGAAASMCLYPYGGSRHDAFLGVFVAAGVGIALSFVARERLTVLLSAAIFLVPLWLSAEQPHYLHDNPQFQKWNQMQDALHYLFKLTPAARTLVVDQQGSAMVNYYVCQGSIDRQNQLSPRLNAYRCNDYQILAVQDWSVLEADLEMALMQARLISPTAFPDPACIFSMIHYSSTLGGGHHPATRNGALVDGVFGKIHIRGIDAANTRPVLPE